MDRKLAAILAADVVGYSALMERDEAGTFARVKSFHKSLLEPTVKDHRGRVFKRMGDGILAEFGSAADAVNCAVALKRRIAAGDDVTALDDSIALRIGINLGD